MSSLVGWVKTYLVKAALALGQIIDNQYLANFGFPPSESADAGGIAPPCRNQTQQQRCRHTVGTAILVAWLFADRLLLLSSSPVIPKNHHGGFLMNKSTAIGRIGRYLVEAHQDRHCGEVTTR